MASSRNLLPALELAADGDDLRCASPRTMHARHLSTLPRNSSSSSSLKHLFHTPADSSSSSSSSSSHHHHHAPLYAADINCAGAVHHHHHHHVVHHSKGAAPSASPPRSSATAHHHGAWPAMQAHNLMMYHHHHAQEMGATPHAFATTTTASSSTATASTPAGDASGMGAAPSSHVAHPLWHGWLYRPSDVSVDHESGCTIAPPLASHTVKHVESASDANCEQRSSSGLASPAVKVAQPRAVDGRAPCIVGRLLRAFKLSPPMETLGGDEPDANADANPNGSAINSLPEGQPAYHGVDCGGTGGTGIPAQQQQQQAISPVARNDSASSRQLRALLRKGYSMEDGSDSDSFVDCDGESDEEEGDEDVDDDEERAAFVARLHRPSAPVFRH